MDIPEVTAPVKPAEVVLSPEDSVLITQKRAFLGFLTQDITPTQTVSFGCGNPRLWTYMQEGLQFEQDRAELIEVQPISSEGFVMEKRRYRTPVRRLYLDLSVQIFEGKEEMTGRSLVKVGEAVESSINEFVSINKQRQEQAEH